MLNSIRDTIVNLEQRMDRRFDAIEQRMDRRFEAIDQRFATVDQKIDKRFGDLDMKMSRQFMWLAGMQVTTLAAVLAALVSR